MYLIISFSYSPVTLFDARIGAFIFLCYYILLAYFSYYSPFRYTIFMADNLQGLANHDSPKYIPYIVLLCYLAPISWLKRVQQLGLFSMLANVLLLCGMVCLLTRFNLEKFSEVTWGFRWHTLPIFFSMATSAFEGAGVVLPVEDSMSDQPVSG